MLENEKIGRTIAHLRRARRLTQQKLADLLFVSHQAVSKWENGIALPDVLTLLKMSRLFGVTMEQILTGDVEFISIA